MEEKEELQNEITQSEIRIIELKNYLTSKDYQTIREMQGGEPMSAETKTACADARAEINKLEELIKADKEKLANLPEEEEPYEP